VQGHEGRRSVQSDALLAELTRSFPNAPQSYGDRATGRTLPDGISEDKAPAFSWVGKVDSTGLRFVASRRGPHFYRIEDPQAVLIRAEDFVGYKTAAEAAATGKTPAD